MSVDPKLSSLVATLGGREGADGGAMVRCPAHSDDKESLSVKLSDSGRLLVYCHAGCSYSSVMDKLKSMNLIPEVRAQLRDVSRGKKIEAIYKYYLNKEHLFDKVRYRNADGSKTFRLRKTVNGSHFYKDVLKGIPKVPLYNQDNIILQPTVYICEGEKDVDRLIKDNMPACTNYDGAAGKWKAYYTKLFKDKNVIILADNDKPGRLHAEKVAIALDTVAKSIKVVEFSMLKDKSDVSDYLDKYSVSDLHALIESTAPWTRDPSIADADIRDASLSEEEDSEGGQRQQGKPKAKYEDYVALYERVLGEVRVDIFSGTPMYWDNRAKLWTSAYNSFPLMRSEAAVLEDSTVSGSGAVKYNSRLIEDHFHKYASLLTPRFLIDLPAWDGNDRIGIFASCLQLKGTQEFDKTDVDNLLTDWLVKALRRLDDPNVRNRILILKGGQNIGKDWFIDSLTYGAGQFAQDLGIIQGDKDSYLQLSRGMFLKISEFDRTAKTEVSILKDMVTKPFTEIRGAYERDIKRRDCRASFISSCNVDDILRDYTGNTRYIVIDVASIEYNYPVRDRDTGLQILAQASELGKNGWKCPAETESKLARYLDGMTPESPLDEITEMYEKEVQILLQEVTVSRRTMWLEKSWIPTSDLDKVVENIAKKLKVSERWIRNQLRTAGLAVKTKLARGYKIPDSVADKFFNMAAVEGYDDSMDDIPF